MKYGKFINGKISIVNKAVSGYKPICEIFIPEDGYAIYEEHPEFIVQKVELDQKDFLVPSDEALLEITNVLG